MGRFFLLVLSLAAVSFGGGNTLMAGLEHALVQTGRLGADQFAFAVALGQSTPGPMAAFTTGMGMAVGGLTFAVAATGALLAVSLAATMLITRIPHNWFAAPKVVAGLAGVAPFAAALALFLGVRLFLGDGKVGLAGIGVVAVVAAGRLRKVPTPVLMIGAIAFRLLLG